VVCFHCAHSDRFIVNVIKILFDFLTFQLKHAWLLTMRCSITLNSAGVYCQAPISLTCESTLTDSVKHFSFNFRFLLENVFISDRIEVYAARFDILTAV